MKPPSSFLSFIKNKNIYYKEELNQSLPKALTVSQGLMAAFNTCRLALLHVSILNKVIQLCPKDRTVTVKRCLIPTSCPHVPLQMIC